MAEDGRMRAPGRTLVVASVVLAALASLFLLLAPTYATVSTNAEFPAGASETTRGGATLLEVEGWRVLGVLLVPIALTAAALFFHRIGPAITVRWLAALLLIGFVVLGLMTVGAFYFPSAVLMGVAAISATRARHARADQVPSH